MSYAKWFSEQVQAEMDRATDPKLPAWCQPDEEGNFPQFRLSTMPASKSDIEKEG